jgi:hypothetical protein
MSEYRDLDTSMLINDGLLFNVFDRLRPGRTVTFIMTARTFSTVCG